MLIAGGQKIKASNSLRLLKEMKEMTEVRMMMPVVKLYIWIFFKDT